MAFSSLMLTTSGKTLYAKAQQGKKLHFTRVAIGDGLLGSGSMVNRTGLINERVSLPIDAIQLTNDSTEAAVIVTFKNDTIAEGFYFREIALIAEDPDTHQELAYLYDNAGEDGEYIPDGQSGTRVAEHLKLLIKLENTPNVTFAASGNPLYLVAEDIDDASISAKTLWSSKKVSDELAGKVPTARKVNGKALTADITLTAADVRARPDTWTPTAAAVGAAPYQVISSGDFNSVTTPGLYTMRSASANKPSTGSYYSLWVGKSDNGNYVQQIAVMEGTTRVFVRYLSSATWSAWKEISMTDHTHTQYVPTSRKVNSKALTADITLSAADVSAVPTTRKVNGKALTADITLTAADVGAAKKGTKLSKTITTAWGGSAGAWTQAISVAGVTAASKVDVYLAPTATDAQEDAYVALQLRDGGQTAGQITLKAKGEKNTIEIPIIVVVGGDLS